MFQVRLNSMAMIFSANQRRPISTSANEKPSAGFSNLRPNQFDNVSEVVQTTSLIRSHGEL